MTTLKQIVARSFDILTSTTVSGSTDLSEFESNAVAQALVEHFSSQLMCMESEQLEEFDGHVSVDLDSTSWNKLNEILSICFPGFSGMGDMDGRSGVTNELAEAIKTQLKEHHFQDLPSFEQKVHVHVHVQCTIDHIIGYVVYNIRSMNI